MKHQAFYFDGGTGVDLALLQLTHRSSMAVTSLEQVQPHVWRQDTGFLASWSGWGVAKAGKTHPTWSGLGALLERPCTLGDPVTLGQVHTS